jgi:hypothetical protein
LRFSRRPGRPGGPGYDHDIAAALRGMGVPAFACTPGLFPDLIASAINRQDLSDWAARNDVVTSGRTQA